MEYTRIIGIDISKDKFDVFIIQFADGSKVTEKSLTFKFNNQSLEEFIKLIEPNDLCVMEATGCYHDRLVRVLHEHQVSQTVINSKQSHYYAKMMGSITKTDSEDAKRLAEFGRMYCNKLVLFNMPDEQELETRALYSDLRVFKSELQATKNRLHARQLSLMDKHDKNLVGHIEYLEARITELERQLTKLVKTGYEEDYSLLIKIPGLGKVCVTTLIMAYQSFIQSFVQSNRKVSAKAFCKHLGLAPMISQSGKRKSKSKIGRSADPSLVSAIFLGTKSGVSVTKKDNPMKTFFKRLKERGFPFKKACIAAAHKVVRIAWTILTTKQPYDPDYKSTKPRNLSSSTGQTQKMAQPNKISGVA